MPVRGPIKVSSRSDPLQWLACSATRATLRGPGLRRTPPCRRPAGVLRAQLPATNAHGHDRHRPMNAAVQTGPAVIRRRGSTPSNKVSTAWVCRSITFSASMVLGPTMGLLFTVSSRGDCGCAAPVNSR